MNIRKWTSPIQELIISGIDLTEAEVYVSFKQGNTTFTYSGEQLTVTLEGEDTHISLHLTQEETGAYTDETILVQVNWLIDGERNATDICYFKPQPNLYEEVIE